MHKGLVITGVLLMIGGIILLSGSLILGLPVLGAGIFIVVLGIIKSKKSKSITQVTGQNIDEEDVLHDVEYTEEDARKMNELKSNIKKDIPNIKTHTNEDTPNVETHTDDVKGPRTTKEIGSPETYKPRITHNHEPEDVFMTKADYMMEKFKNRKNAWKATGIILIFLLFISLGVIAYLGLYITVRCNDLYTIVNLANSATGWLGLDFSGSEISRFLGDPCPNLIGDWP